MSRLQEKTKPAAKRSTREIPPRTDHLFPIEGTGAVIGRSGSGASAKKDFFDDFLSNTPGTKQLRGLLELVDRSFIDVWPAQPRDHITADMIAEKRRSIADGFAVGKGIAGTGIEQPLILRFHPDPAERAKGRFMIVDGEVRYRGTDPVPGTILPRELPCIIRDLTDEEAWEVAGISGIAHQSYTPLQEARIVQRFMNGQNKEKRKLSVRETELRFGKKKSWITDRLVIADPEAGASDQEREIIADLQRMVSERPDSLFHARELKQVRDTRFRRTLIREVLDGLSIKKLRERINPAAASTSSASGSYSGGAAVASGGATGATSTRSISLDESRGESSGESRNLFNSADENDPIESALRPCVSNAAKAVEMFDGKALSYEYRERALREVELLKVQVHRLDKILAR